VFKFSILKFIKELHQPVFTTQQLAHFSGKSLSAITQGLNFLQKQEVVFKIYRGIWAEVRSKLLSPYAVIPFLLSSQRVYVSFISALHLHGIIEQIPQVITLASMRHTKIIHTKIATFSIHQIAPSFFKGFNWYKGQGSFLIAEPEKALVDCLYLSTRKKKQFGYFPELNFSKAFSFRKAKEWITIISNNKLKVSVQRKLDKLFQTR